MKQTKISVTVRFDDGRQVSCSALPDSPALLALLVASGEATIDCQLPDDPDDDTPGVLAARRLIEADQLRRPVDELDLAPDLMEFVGEHAQTLLDVVQYPPEWWRERGATEAQLSAIIDMLYDINERMHTRLALGMRVTAYRNDMF